MEINPLPGIAQTLFASKPSSTSKQNVSIFFSNKAFSLYHITSFKWAKKDQIYEKKHHLLNLGLIPEWKVYKWNILFYTGF